MNSKQLEKLAEEYDWSFCVWKINQANKGKMPHELAQHCSSCDGYASRLAYCKSYVPLKEVYIFSGFKDVKK